VRAEDVGAIASGLAQLVTDDALRARLRAAGPPQAHQYTWDTAARQVLMCYQRLMPS
jgi:hypothetical protein